MMFSQEQKVLLFVNKKKQKNFDFFDVALSLPHTREADQKFFGSFFQKRTSYFSFPSL